MSHFSIEPSNLSHQQIIFDVCKRRGVRSLQLTTLHTQLIADGIDEYIKLQDPKPEKLQQEIKELNKCLDESLALYNNQTATIFKLTTEKQQLQFALKVMLKFHGIYGLGKFQDQAIDASRMVLREQGVPEMDNDEKL